MLIMTRKNSTVTKPDRWVQARPVEHSYAAVYLNLEDLVVRSSFNSFVCGDISFICVVTFVVCVWVKGLYALYLFCVL